MLTKTDLKKMGEIVREEVETESQNTKEELQAEMKMNLVRTLSEMREIKNRLKNVEIKVTKIQKDTKYTVNFLDKEHLRTKKRVKRVEKHLGLEPASL